MNREANGLGPLGDRNDPQPRPRGIANRAARSGQGRAVAAVGRGLGALSLLAALGVGALVGEGCGSGQTDYRCDATGCFDCDGYGCKPVVAASPTPCSVPGDAACKPSEECTDAGCLPLCKADSDCARGTVCRAGHCAAPTLPKDPTVKVCAVAADCGASGFECVDGKCVTAPACTGATCTCKYSSDCGDGRICVDGKCGKKCDATTPCAAGLKCGPLGTCVDGAPVCGAGAGGAACAAGQRCVDGHCAGGCAASADCKDAAGVRDPGLECTGGACVPTSAPATTCTGAAECSGTQKCVDGFCRFLCSSNDECLAHDVRIGACSTAEGICRSPGDLTAKCTAKADCGAKDCVDGQCK